MTTIREAELIVPALFLLADAPHGLNTTQLMTGLRALLHPTGDDLLPLENRNDDRFSQKVRNLTSHNTLIERGLAKRASTRNAPFTITEAGLELSRRHASAMMPLADFSFSDTGPVLKDLADDKNVIVLDDQVIREGELKTRTAEYRTRSRELRQAAVKHYTQDGRLPCAACGFDFSKGYQQIGDGFIHIHHLKPVSFLRGEPINMTQALTHVRPLCANCHQMVHRSSPPIPIATLQSILKVSYAYT